jgi:ATP-binding protein involved in chromosome partitioning
MALQIYQEKTQEPLSRIKKIIGVAAGKGGVGKSTVTVNLALALKKIGYSVGVLDTDIYGPSVRMMLPEDLSPKQTGDIILPAICRGIPMISMAYFRPDNQASVVRAPIANKIIKQFLKNVAWGDLDFLLVDFPPGTGDIQLTLSQEANLSGIIMVTTPQNVALMDVRKAMDMFTQVKVPVVGIVENMSYFLNEQTNEKVHIFGKGGGVRLSLESGVPFLGAIPLHPKICDYGDLGKSIFDDESHLTASAFMEFAKKFILHVKLLEDQSKESLQGFNLIWKEM